MWKKGHLRIVYSKRKKSNNLKHNYIDENNDRLQSEFRMFNLQISGNNPISLIRKVNNQNINFVIDAGAAVSVIS